MTRIAVSPITQRRVAIVALVLTMLMVVDVSYQIGMHLVWRGWITRQSKAMATTTQPTTQPAKADKAKPPEVAAAIKKRNLFQPPPQIGHGLSLTGVLGNMAFFAGRDGKTFAVKEGDSSNGIKVKSIKDYEVVIEYQNKPETMKLFAGGGGGGGTPSEASMPMPEMPAAPGGPPPTRRSRSSEHKSAPVTVRVPPGGGEPVIEGLPPGVKIEMHNSPAEAR